MLHLILDAATTQTIPQVGWSDLGGILPVLILFGTAAAVLVLDLFLHPEPADETSAGGKPLLSFVSLLGVVLAGAQVCASLVQGGGGARDFFLKAVQVDRFSSAMSLLIILGTGFTLLGAVDTLRRRALEHGEFHALVLFAAGSMVLFTQSSSLIMVFLSLETLSMCVYVLAAFSRDEKRAVEGALKYFVLGGLSSGFLLLGLTFLYGATRSSNLAEIAAILASREPQVDVPLLAAGLGLTVIGLAFKVGAFPFHAWVPDAYEGALSVVTGFMAVTVKVASFAVLLRFAVLFGGPGAPSLATATGPGVRGSLIAAISALAVVTMVFGNLVAIVQTSVKRMLAYSAIAHTGYLLVGVVAAMDGTPGTASGGGAAAVLFYLFPYALMTLGAFLCLSHLGRAEGDLESFESYRGLSRSHPIAAGALLLIMVSFAGIPPTAGFWGKFYVFREALAAGHWGLALTGIVTSIVSVYYYLGVVVAMYMQAPDDAASLTDSGAPEPRTAGKIAITLAAASIVIVGLFPDLFLKLTAACGLS